MNFGIKTDHQILGRTPDGVLTKNLIQSLLPFQRSTSEIKLNRIDKYMDFA